MKTGIDFETKVLQTYIDNFGDDTVSCTRPQKIFVGCIRDHELNMYTV